MDDDATSVVSSNNSSKYSKTSSRIRNVTAQAAEEALKKVKEKEAHPERRLLFRPKVYESWRDDRDLDDEIEERERLIEDISKHELNLKKKKEEGDFDSDEDEDNAEEGLAAQKAKLERLKGRKHREEAYKARIEAETLREEQEKALAYEEKCLSELQNPSIYGWFYTDGYYDNEAYFGVKDNFVEKMTEQRETWKEKWLTKNPETFTEKFKRHFWPPKLFAKKRMFRTRGTYMDFPEVIADWPKNLDVNFEKGEHEILSTANALFQEEPDPEALLALQAMAAETEEDEVEVYKQAPIDKNSKQVIETAQNQGKDTEWYDWYYDDEIGEFFRKKDGFMGDYYMDEKNNCWRYKRPQRLLQGRHSTPYDWYFDFEAGKFVARESYKGLDEFVYDNRIGVYKLQAIIPTASKKKNRPSRPSKPTKAEQRAAEVEADQNRINVHSFYFDEEEGKWIPKSEASDEKREEILWDDNGQRYAVKVEGEWRGLTGLSPDDYYFTDKTGRFSPKPPRQGKNFKYYSKDGVWRKTTAPEPETLTRTMGNTPNDYYFDEFEGQFKLKAVPAAGRYWLQTFAGVWRKNAPPKSGMYPEEYYYDRNKKLWLPRVVRMEMLHNAKTLKNQWTADIHKGTKELSYTPASYYWDIEEGQFVLKLKNAKYFMDKDGFWKSVNLRDHQRNRIFEYDFYFDFSAKDFARKQKGDTYVFNKTNNVWTTEDAPETFECDFAFDVELEKWVFKGSLLTDGFVDIGITIKPHSRKHIKIPSDFWFHETEGRFYPKKLEDVSEYFYNFNEGVWKKKGIKGTISVSGLHPRNFFFDDTANRFKLQVDGQKKDYWYDNNNKIFRHVVATGETRSGHQPSEYHWNSDLRAFVLEKPHDKLRGKIISDLPEWEPMRRYDKGWLPSQDVSSTKTNKKNSKE